MEDGMGCLAVALLVVIMVVGIIGGGVAAIQRDTNGRRYICARGNMVKCIVAVDEAKDDPDEVKFLRFLYKERTGKELPR